MKLHGAYVVNGKIVANNLILDGAPELLKMLMRGDDSLIPAGGNFYIGMCGAELPDDPTLATLPNEPDSTGGYARQAITRDELGWPTIEESNGVAYIKSAPITFAATGANYSEACYRLFLCNVASGTDGKLFSVSGALETPLQVADGQSINVSYILYLS